STQTLAGETTYSDWPANKWQDTVTNAAGTWTNIAFSLALVVSACALTHFVKMPKAAKVAILTWAVVTNSFWIFGELFYSALSASAKDHGDFGNIANNGPKHLAAASAGIIVIVLLSLIALQRIYLRRY
nr:hypothetical protein [Chlamydiota bacterium]